MSLIFAAFLLLFIPGLLAIALVVAIALPRAIRDQERLETNHCLECGYDLRETAGPCPECGRPLSEVTRPGPDVSHDRPTT